MNPLIPIIAQYGIEFVIELLALLKAKEVPDAEDFIALKAKYASKSAAQYLEEAKAQAAQPVP